MGSPCSSLSRSPSMRLGATPQRPPAFGETRELNVSSEWKKAITTGCACPLLPLARGLRLRCVCVVQYVRFAFGIGDPFRAHPPCAPSQLRLEPPSFDILVGLSGVEPLTSRLSGARSNQLSYRPIRRQGPVQLGPSNLARLLVKRGPAVKCANPPPRFFEESVHPSAILQFDLRVVPRAPVG